MGLTRVSVVQYLNSVPLVWGMLKGEQQGRYALEFTTPAGCADAVRQGKADIGIIPSIEYQRLERAQILSGISIASKGEVKSVLLLSKLPIDKIKSVAIDNSSRTSAALLRIMMRKFYSRFITVTPSVPKPVEMLKRADAAMVIGDPALTFNGQAAHVYDLGAEWKRLTGLPFVYALWVGKEECKPARFRKDFEESRDFGTARVDDIAAEYGPTLNMQPEAVKAYLTQHVDYSLDEENRMGLRHFYKLAREVGIIPVEKDLYFV
jgi:chorismate dehydratase